VVNYLEIVLKEFQRKLIQYILNVLIKLYFMPSEKASRAYDLQMDIFYKQKEILIENIDNHMDLFIDNKVSKEDAFFRVNEISTINKIFVEINLKIEESINNWKKYTIENKEIEVEFLPLIEE